MSHLTISEFIAFLKENYPGYRVLIQVLTTGFVSNRGYKLSMLSEVTNDCLVFNNYANNNTIDEYNDLLGVFLSEKNITV